MTITLTKEELAEFQQRLAEWHSKRTEFICLNMPMMATDYVTRITRETDIHSAFRNLSAKFEEKNPKPDWRTLL